MEEAYDALTRRSATGESSLMSRSNVRSKRGVMSVLVLLVTVISLSFTVAGMNHDYSLLSKNLNVFKDSSPMKSTSQNQTSDDFFAKHHQSFNETRRALTAEHVNLRPTP